jgi:hypothetical protein
MRSGIRSKEEYVRKMVRHFEMYTNTGHEGTNNGTKSGGATKVLPQFGLDKSTMIMVDQDSTRCELSCRVVAARLQGKALLSDSTTVNDLMPPAETIVQLASKEIENYASLQTCSVQWLVARSAERNRQRILPQFARVYVVTLTNGVLNCSCGYFEFILLRTVPVWICHT